MSWQSYVDDQLVGSGCLSKGVIFGANDGGSWAQSPGFQIKAGEGAALVNLFKNPANVFASGATLCGVKYMGIKGDGSSIYGKKGATGNAAMTVEKLADYLRENGY
eukprot:gene9274-10877_t